MDVEVGSWHVLPSHGGDSIALDDTRLAVSGSAHLAVFDAERQLAAIDAPSPAPGQPRFFGERVYWGPGFLDLDTGVYSVFDSAQPQPVPAQAECAFGYAWSTRADRLLSSLATPTHARVTVYDGRDGAVLTTLFDGPGLPPRAAWLGQQATVVGFGYPRVFDRGDKPIAELALSGGTIASIDGTGDETRVLVVDQNHALVWVDAESWTIVDRWPGSWLAGAVSPDGRVVAALEPWGKVHLASVSADRLQPLRQVAVDDRAISLALSDDRIATVGGGEVRWARLNRTNG